MGIHTDGVIAVDAEQSAAFDFVSDPARLARCVPGCQDVLEISPGRYSAVVRNKVAFITLDFKVIVEIAKIEPPNAIEAKITGDAVGHSSRVTAAAALRLESADNKGTQIHYSTDVALMGKLGGMGESVFRAKSAELAREFAANLKAAIEQEVRERTA